MLLDDAAALAVLLAQGCHRFFAAFEGGYAADLGEDGGAGVEAFRERCPGDGEVRWGDDPAKAPAGHGPGFGEAVHHYQGVVFACHFQEGWGVFAVEEGAVVDLVGDEEDVSLAAEGEQLSLVVLAHHPAGGVAGGVDEDRAGFRAHRGDDLGHVETPAGFGLALAHGVDFGAGDAVGDFDVGPVGADD